MSLEPAIASYLMLGLVAGITHALDADHVAAVTALATRSRSVGETLRVGVAWGAGHALVLGAFAGLLVAIGSALPERVGALLELLVGLMLVALGGDVLRKLVVERVHFHRHRHGSAVHLHAHSHKGEYRAHDPGRHERVHAKRLPLRPLLVGMTHGLAGSAALVVLAAGSASTPLRGIACVLLFGAGSIAGMAALSLAIALPLKRLARVMTWTRNGVHGIVGLVTLALGASMMLETARVLAS